MAGIQLLAGDAGLMRELAAQLDADLRRAGLAGQLQVGEVCVEAAEACRGDPVTLATVWLTAVGAGGALSVLLGRDGVLAALARVLEKYVAGRQAEVVIEKANGDRLQVRGPVGEIKAILQQLKE